ncbi:MAG: MFS transporter [Mycobacteriaceae bacterium]
MSLLLVTLDNTILNVTLPTLVRDLQATTTDLQWIVDSYILVFAGLLLVAGSLADRLGRKRTFLAGVCLFEAGSAWAAFSGSVDVLIAARASMGIGAALIMPSTLAIITDMFRDPGERQRAIGLWAATSGLGIAVGPVIGGVLSTTSGGVGVPAQRPGRRGRDRVRDPAGPELAHRSTHPMLELRFFRDRAFSGAVTSVGLVMFGVFGTLFVLTQYLQFVLGYTPLEAGIRALPAAGAIAAVVALSTGLVVRAGTRVTITSALCFISGGPWLLSQTTTASTYGDVVVGMVLLGAGAGQALDQAARSAFIDGMRVGLAVGAAVAAAAAVIALVALPPRSRHASRASSNGGTAGEGGFDDHRDTR